MVPRRFVSPGEGQPGGSDCRQFLDRQDGARAAAGASQSLQVKPGYLKSQPYSEP